MRFWTIILYFLASAVGLQQVAAQAKLNLSDKANIIIRSEETVFTVNAVNSGTTNYKVTATILNEKGRHRSFMQVPYDKLSKVYYLKGTLYNKDGKKIKSLKNSEIKDVSAISDFSLFEDNRVKMADLSYVEYPYTVEFDYQVTSSNMLFYPIWRPQDEENLAVEKASFQVKIPAALKLRYTEKNLKTKVQQQSTATHQVYNWQVENLAAVVAEPLGPGLSELIPEVRTAPSNFEVQGYAGNMDTWQNYGHWLNKLNKDRDALPEATKQKLKSMVANAKTEEEKIKIVYDFLQQKTRYVSIQLGIGGWQPFEATFVDAKGYGDCKALTNYMQSMLQAVNIPSYHAVIRAGENVPDIKTDFPSSQFNHVVLCVPMPQDTVWLECTSQTVAAGYMGSFTGGRHALLVTPEGGKLVKTPAYKATDNTQKRTILVKLDEKGNAKANITTLFTGTQQEDRDQVMQSMAPDAQRKWLYQQIAIPAFEINTHGFSQQKARLPQLTEKLELTLRQCGTMSGKRMFVAPNLMNKWTYTPDDKENRQTDIVRRMGFLDVDSVEFELPEGYALEHKPQDISLTSEFGKYTASTKVTGNKISYTRTLQMGDGRFKPTAYVKLIEFYNSIIKADSQQIVFVKNTL